MVEQNRFQAVPSPMHVLGIALEQAIEREYGVPVGSRLNLESVIRNIEGWVRQTREVLELLDERKHFHVIWMLRCNIQNYYEPALESAKAKLKQVAF